MVSSEDGIIIVVTCLLAVSVLMNIAMVTSFYRNQTIRTTCESVGQVAVLKASGTVVCAALAKGAK